MPSGQRDTIVGGGLQPVAPSTQFHIPMFADIIPEFLTDSIARQVAAVGLNVTHIVIGPVDPPHVSAAVNETFRTVGGIISSTAGQDGSVVIGEAATVTGASGRGAVAVGFQANARQDSTAASVCVGNSANDNNQSGSVVVGQGAFGGGGLMVAIGRQASGQGGSGVVIGSGANLANASSGFAIGFNATQRAVEGMAIGNGSVSGVSTAVSHSIAIGNTATIQGGDSIAIGNGSFVNETSFFAENVVIGHGAGADVGAFESVAIGYVAHAAHDSAIILGSRQTSDFQRQFKVGTGTGGLGAKPIFGVFIGGQDTYAGYEGITYRHVNGSGTDNSVGPLQFVSPRGTGNGRAAVGGLFAGIEFYTAAVPAASSATLQAQALNFKVLPQTSPAPTNTDAPVAFPNYFDGANGQAGTILNAPKAGDPQAWLPFNLKGVVHWVPCWHL